MRAFVELWDEITPRALRRHRREAAPLPLRRAGQLARPDRGAAGEQRPAHRARDARRHAVARTPAPARCSCRPGTRRSACRGRGTSSGRCACSRCWPTRPTCSSTTTCSTARASSRRRSRELVAGARAEIDRVAGDGRRGRGRRERLHEGARWSRRTPRAARGSRPARTSSSASTSSPTTEPNPLVAGGRRRASDGRPGGRGASASPRCERVARGARRRRGRRRARRAAAARRSGRRT